MTETVYTTIAAALEMLILCRLMSIIDLKYDDIVKSVLSSLIISAVTLLTFLADIYINIGINLVLITLVIMLIYRGSLIDTIFDVIAGMTVIVLLESLCVFVISSINRDFYNSFENIIIELAVIASAVFIMSKVAVKFTGISKLYDKYRRACWLIFADLFFVQLAATYNWNETSSIGMSLIILIVLIVIINIALACSIVSRVNQKKLIAQQQEMVEMKEGFIKAMAADKHEFNRHLQVIYEMSKDNENIAAIRKYVGEIVKNKNRASTNLAYFGDSILSAYLNGKKAEADERGIVFSVLVMDSIEKLPVSHKELIEITGNLVDNAFDAVADMDNEKKKVFFEISKENDKLKIQTINYISQNQNLDAINMSKTGYSTKKGMQRGFGLSNVKSIADSHNGKLSINMNDEVIVIKVLF